MTTAQDATALADRLEYTSTGQIAACKCGSFPRLCGDGARPDDGFRSLWCQTCMEHVTRMMSSEREVIDHWNDQREKEHAALRATSQTPDAASAPETGAPEIEVTSEMITAGREVIASVWLDFTSPTGFRLWDEVLSQTFRAMTEVRLRYRS